jgi:hypothetical protein
VSFSEFRVKWSTCLNTLCFLNCALENIVPGALGSRMYSAAQHDRSVPCMYSAAQHDWSVPF